MSLHESAHIVEGLSQDQSKDSEIYTRLHGASKQQGGKSKIAVARHKKKKLAKFSKKQPGLHEYGGNRAA